MTNERLDDLAAKLWAQHREALEFLVERSPQGGAGIFGRLYEAREQLATEFSAAAETQLVLDDTTRNNIRFAVPEWDTIPEMLSATGWTASNRLLLLELAPSGDRNSIRLRFVLGVGDQKTRERFYGLLQAAGLKSNRRQITTSWTRIATETLVSKLDESEQDPDEILQAVIRKASAYVKREIPKATVALRSAMAQKP